MKDERGKRAINLDGTLWTKLEVKEHTPAILIFCRRENLFAHLGLRAVGYKPLKIIKQRGLTHWQYTDGLYLSEKGKKNKEWAYKISKHRLF